MPTIEEYQALITKRSRTRPSELVTGTARRFRREFNDPALPAFDVSTGPGMSTTVANGALVVTTGTTANSVTTVTSKQAFTVPFKASMGFKISQKIAGQEFYVEAVAINEDGTLDESVVAAWRVAHADSATTTACKVETRNGGAARSASGNLTGPTQTTDSIFDIVIDSEEAQFHARAMDSTAAKTLSSMRNSTAPDPNRLFVLRYRIVNTGTAPATTTTFTSQFVTVVDYTEIQVEVTSGPGGTSSAQALPIVAAGGSLSVSSAVIGASSTAAGATPAKVNSAATTNATLVKNSAARIYGYQFANTHATAWRYVKVYNLTTAPTVGTSTVFYTIPLPPSSTVDIPMTIPIAHATGFSYAITANPADNDTTAIGAGEVIGHFMYA